MLHLVAHQVRHEEEVAVTVAQFHFRSHQVISVYAEVGGEETLYISLAFHGTAYR